MKKQNLFALVAALVVALVAFPASAEKDWNIGTRVTPLFAEYNKPLLWVSPTVDMLVRTPSGVEIVAGFRYTQPINTSPSKEGMEEMESMSEAKDEMVSRVLLDGGGYIRLGAEMDFDLNKAVVIRPRFIPMISTNGNIGAEFGVWTHAVAFPYAQLRLNGLTFGGFAGSADLALRTGGNDGGGYFAVVAGIGSSGAYRGGLEFKVGFDL